MTTTNPVATGTVATTKIVWDPSIYPRSKWNTSTIEVYADAMTGGSVFPPLVLEHGTNRLLDGKHRWEAFKKIGAETIDVEWHIVPDGIPILLYAASLSSSHGDRLARPDQKQVCIKIYTENPELKQKDVAAHLKISTASVSTYVSHLLEARREERRSVALRLTRLGWTQQDVADRLGISRQLVGADAKNFSSELFGSGHTDETVAERLHMSPTLVRAIRNDGLDDAARMDALGIKIQPYDVWNFSSCHDLMGDNHPGRIPGQLVCHVLYFYTQPGDLVVDPMVGSGTTLDACLLMGRRCFGYDIDERHERPDVIRHDIDHGWPDTVTRAQLIFWDPPYFDKMDHTTIGDDGYITGSISGLDPDAYIDWFAKRFAELAHLVQPRTRLAFVMSDWDSENAKRHGNHPGIFLWDYADVLRDSGWTLRRRITNPLPQQLVHPDIVIKFRDSRRMARLTHDVIIAEAPA